MSISAQTVNVNASCHCKTHTYSFPIPLSHLPLRGSHCHCNQCRHGGGVLFASYARLPPSVPLPYSPESPAPSTLQVYQTIPQVKRYFCRKCGTHLFYCSKSDAAPETENWSVATGAISKTGDGIVEYKWHEHVQVSTQEDGIDFIALLNDKLPRYPTDESDRKPPLTDAEIMAFLEIARPPRFTSTSTGNTVANDPSKLIEISCRCGSVRALLSRPLAHPENKWLQSFATTSTNTWKGSHCICQSCRLSSGYPVMSWIFPSHEHLQWLPSPNPAPLPPGKGGDYKAAAGMSYWRSSVDVERSFCATCGATVLYEVDDRPGLYDLAVGLLVTNSRAGDGLMLREWVQWEPQIDYCEDADRYDKQLGTNLTTGHAEYIRRQ
jgi:hypothetical protein